MKRSACLALLVSFLFTSAAVSAADNDGEIRALAEQADIRAALEHLVDMEEELLADLVELTEIPAPPFGEGPRGERFAEMLAAAGLSDIATDEAGNVIGRRPGRDGERVIALTAHLDTVFPIETDVTVRVEGDTYTAPGIGDNTRGVVVLLGVLRALEKAGIETAADLLFIGNTGESLATFTGLGRRLNTGVHRQG